MARPERFDLSSVALGQGLTLAGMHQWCMNHAPRMRHHAPSPWRLLLPLDAWKQLPDLGKEDIEGLCSRLFVDIQGPSNTVVYGNE